jgi:hypothetical protein
MLVQYSDDLVDGVCSIHCLGLSLGVNVDREPKMIWGPDYGSAAEPRPLVPVEKLTYLIGADMKHAMTKKSKHSFAAKDVAEQFRQKHGGDPRRLQRGDQAVLPRHGGRRRADPQEPRRASPEDDDAEAGLS